MRLQARSGQRVSQPDALRVTATPLSGPVGRIGLLTATAGPRVLFPVRELRSHKLRSPTPAPPKELHFIYLDIFKIFPPTQSSLAPFLNFHGLDTLITGPWFSGMT